MKSKQNILFYLVLRLSQERRPVAMQITQTDFFFSYIKRDLPCCCYGTVMTSFPQRRS